MISQGNRYDWDTSRHPETETLQVGFFPNGVNGEQLDYENPTVSYDNGPMTCDFSLTCDGTRKINCTLFVTVNGYIQPFRVENGGEEQTSYTIPVKEEDFQKISLTIDRPVYLSSEHPSYVAIHLLANYDELLENESDEGSYSLSVYEFFRISPVSSDLATKEFPPSASAEEVGAVQNGLPDEAVGYNGISYGVVRDEDQTGMPSFKRWMKNDSSENYRLALQQEAGRYRTILLRDGQLVEAFGGKSYLDWESSGLGNYWEVPISPDVLGKGSHIYYAVTYCLDIMNGDTVQCPFLVTEPYTIVV
ncbi:hypothetical protein [Solibaculum mannosilyticum]|uniref:hypothetical protein n=1 Tax=Solibaculum mannosilyticum TaxID=2780922 RepID=UPI0036F2B058